MTAVPRHPNVCFGDDHDWTEWGPSRLENRFNPDRRYRRCRRCGSEEDTRAVYAQEEKR